MIKIEEKKNIMNNWFDYLQSEICNQFLDLENELTRKEKNFKSYSWHKSKKEEGGGKSCLLLNGKIFEKVGVNKSTVSGKFKKNFQKKILGANKNPYYWASGISVVAHMKNPKIPAVHFNTRFIVTQKEWFGGGIDATPCLKDLKEKKFFHNELRKICNNNKKNYNKYKNWCDKYFFLAHRNESRGIGGIFFDYELNNWEKNFKFVRDVGLGFIEITKTLIKNKIKKKWSRKEKEIQLLKRSRYTEFNILYDRGTKFGLNSGGSIKSILMSLPPKLKWE